MRRRTLILSAGAAVLGLPGAAPAFAEAEHTLRLGYAAPEDSPLGAGAKLFQAEIAGRTAGRYKIELYPRAALGDETGMLKGVQSGAIDLAFITGAPLPNLVLETGVFSIPFMFRNASHARDMLDSPVGQACLGRFADRQLVGLAWGENGMRQLTNSKRPVSTPADVKSLKLGLPQSAVMMIGFEALGANVRASALPALFEDLRSGRLDGQDNPIATVKAAKLWRVQTHLTLTNHIYDPAVILMSPLAHDALCEQDRDAFAEASKAAGLASRRYATVAQATGVESLSQAGMQVVHEIDRTPFLAAMAPARQKYESLFSPGLVEWVQGAS
jgi:tripartite ATP-independent transporter DctP family solute receptor